MMKRDHLFLWLRYGLALLPLLILEHLWFSHLLRFGVGPGLLPLAVGAAAVLEGPAFGAGYGLYAGIFLSLNHPGSAWAYLFALSLLGFLCGYLRQGLHQNFIGCLICGAAALCCLNLGRVLVYWMGSQAQVLPLLRLAGLEVLTSLLFFPLVYLLLRLCRPKGKGLRAT